MFHQFEKEKRESREQYARAIMPAMASTPAPPGKKRYRRIETSSSDDDVICLDSPKKKCKVKETKSRSTGPSDIDRLDELIQQFKSDQSEVGSASPCSNSGVEILSDDTSIDKAEDMEEATCLHGNPQMPILPGKVHEEIPISSSKIIESVMKLANGNKQDHICSQVPINVDRNCCFVIDINSLKDPSDAKCDDMGSWECLRTFTSHHVVSEDGTHVQHVDKSSQRKSHTLVRRRYKNRSSPDLTKVMAQLYDCNKNLVRLVFLGYRFENEEHAVNPKPHGNCKDRTEPYCRTKTSVLSDIREKLTENKHSNKKVCAMLEESAGGLVNAASQGSLPRNASQVKKMKQHVTNTEKNEDPLFTLSLRHHTDIDMFVRFVSVVPPLVFLFNDRQLVDLKKFCCGDNSDVMGVDITFRYGPFYVCICSYKNLFLQSESSEGSPVLFGPVMIHKTKDAETYNRFFQFLTTTDPELGDQLNSYGTDGEEALISSLNKYFPFAVHLRCKIHLKKNIERSMMKMTLPSGAKKIILEDIFGSDSKSGLIHAAADDFHEKMSALEKKWADLEASCNLPPRFYATFKKNFSRIIRDNMLISKMQDMGLGSEAYSQNSHESLNAVLRKFVNSKENDINDFVSELESCINQQQRYVDNAFLGKGKWSLRPEYQHLMLDQNTFFSAGPAKRKELLERVYTYQVLPRGGGAVAATIVGTRPTCTVPEPNLGQPTAVAAVHVPLDVKCLLSSGISAGEVIKLSDKAERLISEDRVKKTSTDPSCKTTWVGSDRQLAPHVVTCKGKKFQCDNACPGFRARGICAHTIATARVYGDMAEFCEAFMQSHKVSLTNLADIGVPKYSGYKAPPRQRSKRKVTHTVSAPSTVVVPAPLQVNTMPQTDAPPCPQTTWQQDTDFFSVKWLKGTQVTTCYGCSGIFRIPPEVPPAPYDLVVVYKDFRSYPGKDGTMTLTFKKQNVHFHLNAACIQRKYPTFSGSQHLRIPPAILEQLSKDHIDLLNLAFKVNLVYP